MAAACIFCKIIKGDIPSMKLFESDKTFAFLDINPLSKGHALVIPKYHGAKLTDIPDDSLHELLPVAKKIAVASGADDFNILQNNGYVLTSLQTTADPSASVVGLLVGKDIIVVDLGFRRIAHQVVDHVHVHMIPKPNETEGLGILWPQTAPSKDQLAKLFEEIKSKM